MINLNNFTSGSRQKILWQCDKNPNHKWVAAIEHRARRGYGCPFCSNHRASEENCIATLNPTLTEQWNQTKNGNLTPKNVIAGSNKQVWWICEKGHEWKISVKIQSKFIDCPFCNGREIISEENSLSIIYPELAKQWHPSKNGTLKPNNIPIKYIKKVWWMCENNHSWKTTISCRIKNKVCTFCKKLIPEKESFAVKHPELIEQWDSLNNITPNDVRFNSSKIIHWICKNNHKWTAPVSRRSQGIGCPFCAGRSVDKSNSLATLNPELSLEWHPTKNGTLKPNDVSLHSNKKVWWICEKGHEWETFIDNRSGKIKSSCPCCSGRKVCGDNSLGKIKPLIAKQWHPTKNGNLTPLNISYGSTKEVWWLCSCGNEWKAKIHDRKSKGLKCPQCNNKKIQ